MDGLLVFDPATFTRCVSLLEHNLGNFGWHPMLNEHHQRRYFSWYTSHRKEVDALQNLMYRVSSSAEELNKFLRGFDYSPMFRPFPERGLGAISIMKMILTWQFKGAVSTILAQRTPEGPYYQAFDMPIEGVDLFQLPGQNDLLIKIKAENDAAVWLTMPTQAPVMAWTKCLFHKLLAEVYLLKNY